jgi:hypothetical protein
VNRFPLRALDGTETLKSRCFEGEGCSGVELCSWTTAVNEIEGLTTGLSRKILQKIDLVTRAAED